MTKFLTAGAAVVGVGASAWGQCGPAGCPRLPVTVNAPAQTVASAVGTALAAPFRFTQAAVGRGKPDATLVEGRVGLIQRIREQRQEAKADRVCNNNQPRRFFRR